MSRSCPCRSLTVVLSFYTFESESTQVLYHFSAFIFDASYLSWEIRFVLLGWAGLFSVLLLVSLRGKGGGLPANDAYYALELGSPCI